MPKHIGSALDTTELHRLLLRKARPGEREVSILPVLDSGNQWYREMTIRDREVGGSNPLAPTSNLNRINYLRPLALTAVLVAVANLWTEFLSSRSNHQPTPLRQQKTA